MHAVSECACWATWSRLAGTNGPGLLRLIPPLNGLLFTQDFRIEEADDFDTQRPQSGRNRLQRRSKKRASKTKDFVRYSDGLCEDTGRRLGRLFLTLSPIPFPVIGSPEWVFLHYEAFQIILQKQIAVLTTDMGLPPELEVSLLESWNVCSQRRLTIHWPTHQSVVRDLWLLHVTRSGAKLPQGPRSEKQDPATTEGEDEASSLVRDTIRETTTPTQGDHEEVHDGNDDEEDEGARRPKAIPDSDRRALNLRVSLVLLYLGCRWLQLPVMMADIQAYVFFWRIADEDLFNGSSPRIDTWFLQTCLERHLTVYQRRELPSAKAVGAPLRTPLSNVQPTSKDKLAKLK